MLLYAHYASKVQYTLLDGTIQKYSGEGSYRQTQATSASILPGSVNEDQLRLGKKMQIWFIPLADERGVCRYNFEIP